MFKAMGRWVKAILYLMTGQIDAARRTSDTNPHVMRAKYEEIIHEKLSRIQQYKQAVAGLIAQQEKKKHKIESLTDDVKRLEDLRSGALAKAKQTVKSLQSSGMSMEAIHADEDYMRCQTAFKDFSSTVSEKQDRITELEEDVTDYTKRIGEHKVQLQSLLRDIDDLKSEAADAVDFRHFRHACFELAETRDSLVVRVLLMLAIRDELVRAHKRANRKNPQKYLPGSRYRLPDHRSAKASPAWRACRA